MSEGIVARDTDIRVRMRAPRHVTHPYPLHELVLRIRVHQVAQLLRLERGQQLLDAELECLERFLRKAAALIDFKYLFESHDGVGTCGTCQRFSTSHRESHTTASDDSAVESPATAPSTNGRWY